MRWVAAIVFAALVSTSAFASDQNGDWWNGLSRNERLVYVSGIFSGIQYEYKVWDFGLVLSDKTSSQESLEHDKSVEDFATKHNEKEFRNVSAGQIADGLTALYSDYRNRRITVDGAFIIVVRSLDGSPDEEVQKLLEEKRQEAAQ